MAIITRNKTTVFGLTTDLANLQQADAAELVRAQAAELVLTNAVAAEATTARAAELVLTNNLSSEVTRATAAEAAELARATAAETVLQTNITNEEAARIAGDLALGVRIDNALSNIDPTALDSLTEIVSAFQAADSTLNGAITTLAASAGTGLSDEVTRATAAELVLTNNLSAEVVRATAAEGVLTGDLNTEVAARIAADTALDTSLKAYADEAVRVGGAVDKTEMVTVGTGDKIELSFAPKNGMDSVGNFQTVRYMDSNGLAYDAEIILDGTDVSGKTFIVSTDTTGEWNGKSVKIQYRYVAAA
jgi:hypothetical protein